MSIQERVLAFGVGEDRLIGVLTSHAAPADTGVVVVVGGPQYRAGSHRQFVHLARRVGAAGYPCLRFDYRGMGDATGYLRNFEQVAADIGVAIDALMQAEPGVRQVALWGLCDGASAALLYLHERRDPRVRGLALLNPWVRTEAGEARTRVKHYYVERLMAPEFWRKLATGGVRLDAVTGLIANLRRSRKIGRDTASQRAYPERMAAAWNAFDGSILLLLSEQDYTAREFEEYTSASGPWQQTLAAREPRLARLAGADHTCSTPQARMAAEDATLDWLTQWAARAAGG